MTEELKRWFVETFIRVQHYEFGVYRASTDYARQVHHWGCLGCKAEAETSYPNWGLPKLDHEPSCKYVEFMGLLGEKP